MEFFHIAFDLSVAPLIYFAVGLPWAGVTRLVWAPLWGAGVLGLGAEFACIFGADVRLVVAILLVLHLLMLGHLVSRRRMELAAIRKNVRDFVGVYALALIPLLAAPFALPGAWGGDWLLALKGGQYILSGENFSPELLARPPLFGASAIPLLLLGSPMIAFQIFCAVGSAGTLQVFRAELGPKSDPRLLWILAGSIFFLQITANAWAKFLCAGYLLAAWQALDTNQRWRSWAAGALLGLAVATHQSAILFVPLVLTRLFRQNQTFGATLGRITGISIIAACVVLPWEIHTLTAFGWKAKWLANPAVSQRLEEMPAWLNAGFVGVTTLLAWGPVRILLHWLGSSDRFSLFRITHELYWFLTATFNSLAGSLLGLVLPWWLALGTQDLWSRAAGFCRRLNQWEIGALIWAFLGQMVLNPFYSPEGSLQTGWVPAGLAVTLWFAIEMTRAPVRQTEMVLRHVVWFGTGPWLAFNVALTMALCLSAGFRQNYLDSDLEQLDRNGWHTLAMAGFPLVQVLLAAGLGMLWWRHWLPTPATVGKNHLFKPTGSA
jgi:hypothetical protein